jgi:hypothetical protein
MRAWRALAVTYAVISVVQAYLAATMGVAWAGALAVVFLAAALGCGVAARRSQGGPPRKT